MLHTGWEAKVDPLQRVVFFEHEGEVASSAGAGEKKKTWRLPYDLRVTIDNDEPDSRFSSPSRQSRNCSASPEKGSHPRPVVVEDDVLVEKVAEDEHPFEAAPAQVEFQPPLVDEELDAREQEELMALLSSLEDFREEVEAAKHNSLLCGQPKEHTDNRTCTATFPVKP